MQVAMRLAGPNRMSLALVLLIPCLLWGGVVSAAPPLPDETTSAWQRKIASWREQRATHPRNFGIFCEPRLLEAIEINKVQLLAFDPQAAHYRSPECRFVVIRSRSAKPQDGTLWEKGLTIPVRWNEQPVCIADVKDGDLALLGRMMRSTLNLPDRLFCSGDGARRRTSGPGSLAQPGASDGRGAAGARPGADEKQAGWVLSYHLPNWISMPVLHGHGLFRGEPVTDRVTDWDQFLRSHDYRAARQVRQEDGGYTLFVPGSKRSHSWDVVAVAQRPDGAALPLHAWLDGGEEHDRLVARMVQDVYLTACRRGTTCGHVMIDRDDDRLVVRAVRRTSQRPGLVRLGPGKDAVIPALAP